MIELLLHMNNYSITGAINHTKLILDVQSFWGIRINNNDLSLL